MYTLADQSSTYRRQILNTLCYSPAHQLEYRYRVRHIEPSLLAKGSHEVDGVIVFVDIEPSKDLPYVSHSQLDGATYFPLRRVKIRWTIGNSDMLRGAERISFLVTLADFVRYDDTPPLDHRQWHDRIGAFDSRRNFAGRKPRYFVISADDIFGKNPNHAPTAWEDVVTAVAKSSQLNRAAFLRLPYPKDVDTSKLFKCAAFLRLPGRKYLEKNKLVKPKLVTDNLEYVFTRGHIYQLDVSVFEASGGSGVLTRIGLKPSSNDLIQVDQPFQATVSGLAEWVVRIACRRNIERTLVTLSLEVSGVPEDAVNSPNPVLFIRLPAPWFPLVIMVILVFIGGFLVSLDPKSTDQLIVILRKVRAIEFAELGSLVAKVMGSFCLAVVAWLGFRKLPTSVKG